MGVRLGPPAGRPHLAHLQLEEPPLLLHLLGDLGAADLRADHPVQLGVLLLLLLDFGAAGGRAGMSRTLSARGPDWTAGQGQRTLTGPPLNLLQRKCLWP